LVIGILIEFRLEAELIEVGICTMQKVFLQLEHPDRCVWER
jgi:hypothetical protein